jgi:hypothetical protein
MVQFWSETSRGWDAVDVYPGQYSVPFQLPLEFLGFPLSRLHELPRSSKGADLPWGSELAHEVPSVDLVCVFGLETIYV